METSDKITQLENEIKVLKNEVQAVLLDIRENVLNAENPFTAQRPNVTSQVVIDHQVRNQAPQPESAPKITPVPAPASAPAPVLPVQEQKPVNVVPANEKMDNEIPEPSVKSNGRKPVEISETEHKKNGKKTPEKVPETTIEDLKQMEQFDTEPPRFELGVSQSHQGQPNLVAYAGLASWVEDSTRRLGKERTQALLDIAASAGLLPPDVKEILNRLTTIKSTEHSYKPTARDYFDSLVKIAALFGNNSDYNAALLLVLAQGDVHG